MKQFFNSFFLYGFLVGHFEGKKAEHDLILDIKLDPTTQGLLRIAKVREYYIYENILIRQEVRRAILTFYFTQPEGF